ncbi:hypothetical protein HY02_04300 [Peptococcaceae bacterium SCADC1_2_3]|nr:hypothetical protein DK28_0214100 [Peptococcaceae bacterium SCADC1_2_3]KFI37699.1 hypothetical protein HY02_04300 [Peptococcaceae bacterium SCADC1_2_3]
MLDVKTAAASVANHSRFLDTYSFFRRKITGAHVAILMYHRVMPKEDDWSLTPLEPHAFDAQLAFLTKNFEVVPLEYIANALKKRKPLPQKAVAITFDDGYQDNYLHAYPILKKYGVPATIFLTSSLIGTKKLFWWDKIRYIINHTSLKVLEYSDLGTYDLSLPSKRQKAACIICEKLKICPEDKKEVFINDLNHLANVEIPDVLGEKMILTWSQVKEMASNGIAFGAHGVTHSILTNLPFDQAKKDIIYSKRDIQEKLGKPVSAFSYPNGNFNSQLGDILRKSGFNCVVVVQGRLVGRRTNVLNYRVFVQVKILINLR